MTHPPGIMTFVPQAKFWFPRSYAEKLWIHTNSVNVPHLVDGEIIWTHSPPDSVLGFTKIKANVFEWTSNTYSLDYVVEWWYYTIGTGGPEFEWGGEVSFAWSPAVKKNCLVIATVAADTDYYFDLPAPDFPYWPSMPGKLPDMA